MTLRVVLSPTPDDLRRAFALRTRVFVGEQGVPPEIEQDGREGECRHVVVYDESNAAAAAVVATGRLLPGQGYAKVQRVAVAIERRGTGLGRVVMDGLEAVAREAGFHLIRLSSQESAIGFYERLGYVAFGERFLEASIVHRDMEKTL